MKKILVLLLTALLLTGCGAAAPASVETAAAPETTAVPETTAAPETGAPETTAPETAPAEPLVPIYADQIAEGSYEITVDSSSSMFRVVKCVLEVHEGKMTAAMTMSGQGYGAVFMGTGAEAPAAPDGSCIPFVQDAEGAKVFTVPLEALDQPVDCAAWSIRKEKWYDRVLVFQSAQLPAGVIEAK